MLAEPEDAPPIQLSDHTWWFGESLDRLMTVEMRAAALAHGKIRPLYDAVVTKTGRRSLAMSAALALKDAIQPGDAVLFVTGAGPPPFLPSGENDGPVGSAVLARALALGLGASPIYVSEPHHAGPIAACSSAAELPIRPGEVPTGGYGAWIDIVPADADIASWAAREFDRRQPRAVVFIEKLGSNAKGVVHGSTGIALFPDPVPDFSPVAAEATRRGIVTIGIGDAGNEIGCGLIYDEVRNIQDFAVTCQCECGDGMATTATADHLLVASVSNWGAYAIESALAHLLGMVDLPHGPKLQRRVLDACLEAGGYEALHCSTADLVDGISGESSVSLTQIMGEMVRISLAGNDRGPIH